MAQPKESTKLDVAEATSQIYKVLSKLEADDRRRVVRAVLTLIGEGAVVSELDRVGGDNGGGGPNGGGAASNAVGVAGAKVTARAFFEQKQPKRKIEELAVAARFRELHLRQEAHEKDDLKAVFDEARINFDKKNYRRDIDNAKTAGFFNKGKGTPLAYYGQKYVDALPDRDKVKEIQRPRGAGRAKRKGKNKENV